MSGWILVATLALAVLFAMAQYVVLKHYQLVSKRVESAAIAVETVTRTILEHQTIQGEKRQAHEESADQSAVDVKAQLDEIHVLVNNDMTLSLTENRNLVLDLIEYKRGSPDEMAALKKRLAELDDLLAQRSAQQKKLDDA
jgi:hypothetical protein